ncbi:hypothetical protein MMC11_009093 [Xylographa trunciseda]|nr:hypothetical protein [Xylographa trunciseda]
MWTVSNTATTHELTLVAYQVMRAGQALYMIRLILAMFGLIAFCYTYAKPGYWTDFGYSAVMNLIVLPSAILWYGVQLCLYPLNRQGSSMTMRRVPYDPKSPYDRGIPKLIKMNAFFEFLGIFLWAAVLVSMVLWPTGKSFRLLFEKPPFGLYYAGAGAAGLQILLCLAQNWLVLRERQFIKIHVARCRDNLRPNPGLGIDNFERIELRALPQRTVHQSASIASMGTVGGGSVRPTNFV